MRRLGVGTTATSRCDQLVSEPAALHTERLRLRPFTDADRAPYAAMNADPVVMAHFVSPIDRGRSDAFVDRIEQCRAERGYAPWAVERLDTGEFIGHAGLWPAEFEAPFTPAVEVGWRLPRSHWGLGFATEAAREALRVGFEELGLREIVSFTAVGNERSWRVMDRIGLRRDLAGDFDHPAVPVGHPVRPHVLYRLDRASWPRPTR